MAEFFVLGIAKIVLVKVGSVAVKRMCSAWGLEGARNNLEETLTAIKAVLRDAEEKQVNSDVLRDWLGKLRDVCYDADDLLEEFEYQASLLSLANEGNITTNLRIFFSGSNSVLLRFTMADKIKGIRKRLDKIAKDRSQFSLREVVEPRVMRRVLPYSLVAPNVIGREEDKERIIPLLIDSLHDERVSVLPIVGLGGLGKTTLARYVYDDENIVRHFWPRMWVYLSKDSDLEKLIRTITGQALREIEKKSGKQLPMGETIDNLDTEQLQSLLRDLLKETIFLLVLDDVWDNDRHLWVDLKNLLMDGAKGSKIIVTTRSNKVASIMGTIGPYKLEGLQHLDCLSLFLSIAFKKEEEKKHPDLVKIGDEIVKKCKGVPLAARTLGSLLCSEFDKNEWIRVRDNDIWKLEQKDGILPALRLSYEQLPPHLRYCFAYCSIFPKGTIFRSTSLIQLWRAQGLIQSSNENQNQDSEDIGDQYLDYLSARTFFQDVEDFDFFRQFKMHDLVHDLATLVAQTECALIDSSRQTIPRTVRHVSFCDRDCQERELPSVSLERNNPRTILFPAVGMRSIDESFVIDCISSFKSMRVLDLSDLDFGAVPDFIGTLEHLRYLSLRGNKSMKKLPNSICKLLNLQTLLLGGCWELEELPKDLGYMINLRHLEITTRQKAFPKKGKETEFFNSLRFLSILRCQSMEVLFGGQETLAALRTLVILDCASLVSLPHSLKRLGALKNLIIFNSTLDLVDGEDVGEGFGSLSLLVISNLRTLQILPQWIQNLRSLETLRIKACPQLSALPEEMHLLTSLKKLEIVNCPQLSKRCEPEEGEDWHKIVHVSDIYLDGQKIKSSTNED